MHTSNNVILNLKLLLLNVIVLLILSEKCDTSVIKSTRFKDVMQVRKYGKTTYTRSIDASILLLDKVLKRNRNRHVCNRYNPMKPDFISRGHRISETKCLGYIWDEKVMDERIRRQIKCRKLHPGMSSVRDGRNATKAEYPHMGAVAWKTKKGHYVFLCASFLISENVLLTAAHIRDGGYIMNTYDLESSAPKLVRLGVENIVHDKFRKPTDIKILKMYTHPDYDQYYSYYDIALIELTRKVKFNMYIRPICLWDTLTLHSNMKISVAGWGITKDRLGANTSDTLKTAQLKVVNRTDCDKKYKVKLPLNHDIQLCFTGVDGDICNGDSGSVVQEKLNTNTKRPMYRAIGVTSTGSQKCGTARFPTIYTKISKSLDWIEDIVWGEDFN